ncbi:hypothetical protein BZG36_04878 [Bifiguratus adelaidae]|uniref:Uncharacterized protein n=1 Tax=Bifiguratus adelaidae TaxID=1938954 RepID=A0A261XVX9_9FUNG|nr:hypothetical protein BZG36_04878 [Bifiguratus adelaidae]
MERSYYQLTPIDYAATTSIVKMVKLLAERGASLSSPFRYAVEQGDLSMIQLLIFAARNPAYVKSILNGSRRPPQNSEGVEYFRRLQARALEQNLLDIFDLLAKFVSSVTTLGNAASMSLCISLLSEEGSGCTQTEPNETVVDGPNIYIIIIGSGDVKAPISGHQGVLPVH